MGQGDAICEHEKTTDVGPICPECAAATSLTHVDPPWPVRHKILVQLAALLVAIGYTVWQNVESWPVLPPPTMRVNSPYAAEFPSHRFAKADIERYATGEIADGHLVDDLNIGEMYGTPLLGVGFVPPKGEGTGFVRYGWPTEVIIYRYDAQYDNVYEETNPSATPRTFRNGWYPFLTYIAKSIDAQGRQQTFMVSTRGLAGPPLVVFIVWGLAKLVRAVLFRVHATDRKGSRRRDQITRRLPLVFAALATIGVCAGSFVPRVAPNYSFPVPWNPTLIDTSLTESELAQIIADPAGEAMLAKRILEVTASAQVQTADCLAYGWRHTVGFSHANAQGGWPAGVIGLSMFEDDGFVPGGSPDLSLKFERTHIAVTTRYGTSRMRFESYTYSFHRAAQLLLGLAVLWVAAGTGTWLIGLWIKKRSARRVASKHCVQCGYDLKGL